MTESKELQVNAEQEVTGPARQTRQGLVLKPEVDIFDAGMSAVHTLTEKEGGRH